MAELDVPSAVAREDVKALAAEIVARRLRVAEARANRD
jgi:hypothetical protein